MSNQFLNKRHKSLLENEKMKSLKQQANIGNPQLNKSKLNYLTNKISSFKFQNSKTNLDKLKFICI